MYLTIERIKRILREVGQHRITDSEPIGSYQMKIGNFRDRDAALSHPGEWSELRIGECWGGRDKYCWFTQEVKIPQRFAGKTVLLSIKTGREGKLDTLNPQLLVYLNGKAIQGMDANHTDVVILEPASGGETCLLDIHAYAGINDGWAELNSNLQVLDRETEKLYYNLMVPLEIAELLDKDDHRRTDILKYLNAAINILDLRKPFSTEFYQSVTQANQYLEQEFYGKYCGCGDVTATCIGHTHLDVAWMWTLSQTREKAARSFSTVLTLMKQYPEYIFLSDQPQLYEYIKEDHPELFEQIKQRVKEGRWEAEGAMWLEGDCSISSGEALVRQILFGTRFFEKEFGVKNRIFWAPDIFGFSDVLPQILKKSGNDYFMTTKVSWNEYNKMPYDTFMWKGMDGTEILTHFISTTPLKWEPWLREHTTTYVGIIDANHIMGTWKRYQQKDLNNDFLVSFGYADGGGGPTKEMLEYARRLEKGIPGCPRVEIKKARDYFERLEKEVEGNKKLPEWVGELYLENHRGSYTALGRNKRYNRKSELLYQDAELFSTISKIAAKSGTYPREEINSGWKTLLLNQFHDIISGTSLKEVYEESQKQYLEIMEKGRALVQKAVRNIATQVSLNEMSILVFNQLSFTRSDIVEIELPSAYTGMKITDDNGKRMLSQKADGNKLVFMAENVPPKGYKAFKLVKASEQDDSTGTKTVFVSSGLMSNDYFDIKLDTNGNITSIYDKANAREVLKPGERANVLQAFEDKPSLFSALDINLYYQEKMWELNEIEGIEVLENGPVRATLRIKRRFLDSQLLQDIHIYSVMPRIDFVNHIDWKEKEILLKAAFPVDVHASKATYEMQFGNTERPTHWNTSWDYARFEVYAQRWADLSEDNYGVSLLNDCKYGYDIHDGVMRLTLIKASSGRYPDADREMHEFTYSLYPHSGDWKKAGTVQMAYALNCPMVACLEESHSGSLPAEFSLVKVNCENVFAEVVKQAEDSEDTILRLYECYNRRSCVTVSLYENIEELWECDLMENNQMKLEPVQNSFEFEIKPYEIRTFKVRTRNRS